MRIAKLSIKNFLGIPEREIEPGKITVISGANAEGKTSIIKALETAFIGSGDLSDRIRDNESKATITVELDDGLTISRRLTAAGNYVDVSKDGFKRDGPQTWLGELVGEDPLSFDPIEFFSAKPARQREMILSAIPITVTPENLQEWFGQVNWGVDTNRHGLEVLAAVEQAAYEQRRDANATVKSAKGRMETLAENVPDDFDAEQWRDVDVSELNEQMRQAGQAEERQMNLRMELAASKGLEESLAAKAQDLLRQVAGIEDEITGCQQKQKQAASSLEDLHVPDASEAQQQLSEYSDAQRVLADVDALEQAQDELGVAETDAGVWDRLVEQARNKPDELLAAAEVPIEGLEINSDAILLNGIEIQNLSDSEKLFFALDIVRAVNRDFGIICIDGAESLDEEHFALLMEQAADDDFQYFITRVGKGELTIETEGGELA